MSVRLEPKPRACAGIRRGPFLSVIAASLAAWLVLVALFVAAWWLLAGVIA